MLRTIVGVVFVFFSVGVAASLPDFTDLIEETSPSVVKINTKSSIASGTRSGGFQNLPPGIREYFEQFDQPQRQQASIGSGFIVSDDGYIVTNHHVIDGAEEITVRLNDRREYNAEVVGTDPSSDLALLKIDERKLPVVGFANSENLEVGDWVVAIGSPFDLDYSASAGIVSAIGRSLPNGSGQNYVPFIQTDVAINPGNSGGPLFNLDGEVVGINSQIYSRSGGFMGLSFAIPASLAIDVIGQLKERGTVSRGWLGVSIGDISLEQSKSFGLKKPQGALIAQVFAGSPAALSGLRAGDIILEFDGKTIEYSHDLPHVVGLISPGKTVQAKVYRQRRAETIEVTVGELSQDGVTTSRVSPETAEPKSSENLGLSLQDMDKPSLRAEGINAGVEVTSVANGSPGYQTGILAGDVIAQLNFEDVPSVNKFQSILGNIDKGTVVPILFYREGSSIFRTIRVDD